MSRLSLFLLGPPRIELDGENISLNNRKATALLAYLATNGGSHSRESLINLLWTDHDSSRARTNLRSTFYILSKGLPSNLFKADRETIALNPDADHWVDVDRFHNLLAGCRTHGHPAREICPECLGPLTDAVKIYGGDFLTGFSLKDSVNFDDWQVSQAQNLHSEMVGALERLVPYLIGQEEFEKTIEHTQRWLEMDRTNEEVHRYLMEAYARSGRRASALEQYEECVKILKEKLGVSPQESTVELYEAIKENRLQEAKTPAAESWGSLSNNIPAQLTSFIGRKAEIEEIKGLLTTSRLVTLTGAGGCGKTRLSLQVAADLVGEYTNGVWLVELAPLSDPTLIAQEVASTLDVQEQAGRSYIDVLSNYLRSKEILLVLDNCEHLIEACADLSLILLQACPNLRILATSREALGITGETIWEVPPLSVPDSSLLPSLQTSDLSKYEAISLFNDRALTILPTFEMTDRIAPTVARICHRLDGIPLAIELAAARVKTLSADQLVERLDDRFGLLTGGSRTALPRHQTLRATVDWSHELLSAAEKTLFRRLSVFAGGFTLTGAEAVCNGAGGLQLDVLDGVSSLMDKSLLRGEEVSSKKDGELRFTMLETIREYALEHLAQSGEEEETRRYHANFFLGLAEKGELALRGLEQMDWLEWYIIEDDNLREALEWSMESGERELGIRLAGALWYPMFIHGHWSEIGGWLERTLSKSEGAPDSLRVKALLGAGPIAFNQGDIGRMVDLSEEGLSLARELGSKEYIVVSLALLGFGKFYQGDHGEGMRLIEESLTLGRELEDKWYAANSLHLPGSIALDTGDYSRARELFEESLSLSREAGDNLNIAGVLPFLGRAALYQGDYDRAREFAEECLPLSRKIGLKYGLARSLLLIGRIALQQGDYDQAKEYLDESSALSREQEDKAHLGISIRIIGNVAFAQGDYEKAITSYKESLTLLQEANDGGGIAECLEGLSEVFVSQGKPEPAARIYGATEAWRENAHTPLHTIYRAAYDRSVAAVRAGMDEEAFAAAWAEGRATASEDAAEYALNIEVA